ncbi:hypothetical protein CUS_8039 [Ruminococcus albus 8]|uniref:Uncharacterized protein n=1 Tax=Ruminococcus albus 8 TaxID=246199 RepID=E9SAS7_RUMAL|nr:hypothetical protein CUS_8039 [Ruminococcus albus 8]
MAQTNRNNLAKGGIYGSLKSAKPPHIKYRISHAKASKANIKEEQRSNTV